MQIKDIILADCAAEEIRELADSLGNDECSFEIHTHIANWKRENALSEIKRYLMYFIIALRYFLTRNNFRNIIGWQQFYALIFCFYCTMLSVKKEQKVIALNFTYKEKCGKYAKLYRWFMGKCVSEKYLDYIHVPSVQYADTVSKEFSFPRERIIVSGFGVKDRYHELAGLDIPCGFNKEKYALAIGRSNRDYDFLVDAWSSIEYPLVIISDTYRRECKNKNIHIYNDIAGEESYRWIVNCGIMIIPIEDGTICSGDTVLLTGMALKRKLIVTKPSTLAEMYIKDGENAVLVEKNKELFIDAVRQVLFSEKYSKLGEQARNSYLKSHTIASMGKTINSSIFSKQYK